MINEFLKNLKKERIFSLFKIASIILNTESLVDSGFQPSITELLLPSLLTTFGPPLIANSIYHRFHFTVESLVIYLLGFLLSLSVYKNRILMELIREVPHISKIYSLIELKNDKNDIFYLISWVITNDLAGVCLKKLIKQENLSITKKYIFKNISLYGGIIFLRKYNYSDYCVIILANIFPAIYSVIETLMEKEKKTDSEVTKIESEELKSNGEDLFEKKSESKSKAEKSKSKKNKSKKVKKE